MSEIPVSDELMDLVFAALDHGIDSVSEGGPLIPFVLAEGAEGRTLTRHVTELLEDGLAQAREQVRGEPGLERVAIAYDGYLTVEGERSDAIFVEGQERGRPASVVFAQRYRPGGRFRKLATVGNPAFTGEGASLF